MTNLRPCPNPECDGGIPEFDYEDGAGFIKCHGGCRMRGPAFRRILIQETIEPAARLWNALPRHDTEAQTTHSGECRRWHLDCAVAKAERILTCVEVERGAGRRYPLPCPIPNCPCMGPHRPPKTQWRNEP